MILQVLMAFLGTLSFSVLFNVPKKELLFCGLAGCICWGFFLVSRELTNSAVIASFISTLVITFVSRYLANIRKMPITIFLVGGIIPLVPGYGIYYTMLNMITNNLPQATAKGIETFKIAGVISIGIVIILSLPKQFFTLFLIKKETNPK